MTILKAILSVTGVENDITRKILNCMTAIKTMKGSRLKKKINFKANGRKKFKHLSPHSCKMALAIQFQ